jgi:hypothetical protein
MGVKINSWNCGGTKYGIVTAMSQKCKFLKLESTSFLDHPSPLPRINSITDLILTRNGFCGIVAWTPYKLKNFGSKISWETGWWGEGGSVMR